MWPQLKLSLFLGRLNSKFRTKFIIVTTLIVTVGLLLSISIAILSISRLGHESSTRVAEGLSIANREYLENYIKLTAQRTNFMIERALSDMLILTEITQEIIDNETEFLSLAQTLTNTPYFQDNLTYNKDGNWYQNAVTEPSVVSVWGHLLDSQSKIKKNVKEHIDKTILLDLIMPAIKRNGADKQWLYLVGPDDASYLRLSPYVNMASEFDRLYPGHNETDFWYFFFPGLVESWQKWPVNPAIKKALGTEITVTPPYEDAAGSGIIISFFHPLWDKNRTKFEGAIGLDFNLKHIIDFIKDVTLAQTGFAFVIRDNGNVLAAGKTGEEVLGLQQVKRSITDKGDGSGVSVLDRFLKDSKIPAFASLKLPQDDQVHYLEIGSATGSEEFVVALQRLKPLNYLIAEKINPGYWTLGFVVSKQEIFASLYTIQSELEKSTSIILIGQIIIGMGMLLILFFGILKLSASLTKGIVALSRGAEQIRNKNYAVRVIVHSQDEIGQLSQTFNNMTSDIQQYTSHLEDLVQARTGELEQANNEITKLNNILKQENLRLSAEVEVARRLQQMVLPKETELKTIKELDIAAYMKPADEVGGDYYDVLTSDDNRVKIGIGDVTGHGLESGVLMLMVQTAIRTLLVSGLQKSESFYDTINRVMYQNIKRIDANKNLTLSLLDYDNQENTFQLTGQHEDVIIIKHDGRVEIVSTNDLGLPIGLKEDITAFISKVKISLEPNDVLLLYTDGITEAMNIDNVQYGMKRLIEVVSKAHHKSADAIKRVIIEDVMLYIGKQKIFDDITLVVIKKN